MKLSKLKKNPNNPRVIRDQKFERLKKSLREFPQMMSLRPIVVDESYTVLGGNMRLEALKANGLKEIPDEWVKRASELTPEQKREFVVKDNAGFGEWDWDALANEWSELPLADWGLDVPEDWLDAGGAQEEDEAAVAEMVDRAAELQQKWKVERGQVWRIGRHRLMCGDSTSAEDVKKLLDGVRIRLVWTDPPYGVSYGAKNEFLNAIARGNCIQTPIENDQLTEPQVEALATAALKLACESAVPGGGVYVASPAGTALPFFISAVKGSGYQFKHSLVWVKQQFVLGRCDYHYRHEIVLYGWKEGAHYFVDNHTHDSVFEVDKPHKSDLHPTTKPTELIAPMIANSSKPGEVVYDCFAGSGSTLVAAESEARAGYGMELTPGYTAVILERLSALGLKPELQR
jgi:DNA modification methylase